MESEILDQETAQETEQGPSTLTLDGNEAAAMIAHRLNEVIAIYPITPSSAMGEWSDEWSSLHRKNLWGTVPTVVEMQSEGGAAGAIHGALQAGALSTTFTSSQGLLLMIPNMYKIAGELTSTVFHVAARSIAAHALSIFGDHSDVMATRGTGFALLSSTSVQEVMDFAAIAQAATLESRVPFLHFFDGFRTSHEVMKVETLEDRVLRGMVKDEVVRAHRARSLSPDRPVLRGSAQNPDVFFQSRERANPYYKACPEIVQSTMNAFAVLTGRSYNLFDYVGDPDAERVVVIMGSGAETVQETVEYLRARGERVGLLKVRLFRPFAASHFVAALPATVRSIAVLDRCKEPGADGEPLYKDVVTCLAEAFAKKELPLTGFPRIIGGRYGLSSKEFTPAMAKAVFDELAKEESKNQFTVGIQDDVSHTSLEFDPAFSIEPDDVIRAVFYGLGADGTVGANKNSIKIIGEGTDNFAQGYFVYDSKKSGTTTTSYLRFGPRPIHSPYLIEEANFVACHQWFFIERFNVLKTLKPGGTFLLNALYGPDEVWDRLPRLMQQELIAKRVRFYVIDAYKVAHESGMGGRINTVMQTCFFAISNVLPKEEAIAAIKKSIAKTYGKKGERVVQKNYAAVDASLANLFEVRIPGAATSAIEMNAPVPESAPEFVRNVTAPMMAGDGDLLPVSLFPEDGTFPVGTSRWEKRNIALEIPVWDAALCIQCNKCALVCPHATLRVKVYDPATVKELPPTFKATPYRGKEYEGMNYTLQVGPEDCTGCTLCVEVCPVRSETDKSYKALNMREQAPLRQAERENYEFFLGLPDVDRREVRAETVKGSQFFQPLFEYSGACSGCGETPYVKLLTQLFGDRAMIANATGCSSIYGGNLPTAPWTTNLDRRGPAWSNSLFEDNAEFGLGMRVAVDKQNEQARELLRLLENECGTKLVDEILNATQSNEAEIYEQRQRVARLKLVLMENTSSLGQNLLSLADNLVRKSVWIVGGDGWAYDIGYGGLDHVLASGRNVNILVLDTEVYSNTGGQMSKSTPRGAVAKFAAAGKSTAKKDLAMMAMMYGNVYVARVAMGSNDAQTLRAFLEAEAYDGPSIIIAYAHCIAHGLDICDGLTNQRLAVETGYWPLLRYNPTLLRDGKNPLKLDSKPPKRPLRDFMEKETRFNSLKAGYPERADRLAELAQDDVTERWDKYEKMEKSFAAKQPAVNQPAVQAKEDKK